MLWTLLLIGTILDVGDTIKFPIMKKVTSGNWKKIYLIFVFIILAVQFYIVYRSLEKMGTIEINLIWDLVSVVLVSITGFLYLNEEFNYRKLIGILLAIISIYLIGNVTKT